MPDMPRRIRLDLMTPEELAIFNMVGEIEKLGAHPLLTDVVVLLGEARNKLADWIDLTLPAAVTAETDEEKREYNNKGQAMENDILEAIAANSIFGIDEVHRVYGIFKSYDLLVAGCEFAQRTGYANLEAACILVKP